jgi:hypothetical protein
MTVKIDTLIGGKALDGSNDMILVDDEGSAKCINLKNIASRTDIRIRESSKTAWHFLAREQREIVKLNIGINNNSEDPSKIATQQDPISLAARQFLHIQFDVSSETSLDGYIPDGTRRILMSAHAKNITLKTNYRGSNKVIFESKDNKEKIFIFILENIQDIKVSELESEATVTVSSVYDQTPIIAGTASNVVELFPKLSDRKWSDFSGELIDWHNSLGPDRALIKGELTQNGLVPNSTTHSNLDPINKISAMIQNTSHENQGVFYNPTVLAWSF